MPHNEAQRISNKGYSYEAYSPDYLEEEVFKEVRMPHQETSGSMAL